MSDFASLAREAASSRTTPLAAGWHECVGRARRHGRAALVYTVVSALDEQIDARIDDLPEDVRGALERAVPDMDLASLEHYPTASLEGLTQTVKGALFEQQVMARLADGTLGDVHLPAGATAQLTDFTEPGVDLVIAHEGVPIDVAQLKASETADLIDRHFDRYPDVATVFTTREAAVDAALRELPAIDTGISNATLQARVHDSFLDQTTTSFGEVIDEVVPQLTLALVAAEWAVLRRNGMDAAAAAAQARSRVVDAFTVSAAAGAAGVLTGTDGVRLPVVLLIRLLLARGRSARSLVQRLEHLGGTIRDIR